MGETFREGGQFFNSMYSGMLDIRKNIFAGMFARAFRAVQFVKSLPEWDPRVLITYGTYGVGGAQAVAAAGFDPQVSMCAAFAPALCDHGGYDNGGQSGWPQYHLDKKFYPGHTDKVLAVTDLVDVCFFGMNIRNAVVYMTAGYLDQQMMPGSVTALFNVIRSKNKTLRIEPESGDRIPAELCREADELINAHVLEQQGISQ
jgi:cephalosporin-C deacetylase-like acetyl esterase